MRTDRPLRRGEGYVEERTRADGATAYLFDVGPRNAGYDAPHGIGPDPEQLSDRLVRIVASCVEPTNHSHVVGAKFCGWVIGAKSDRLSSPIHPILSVLFCRAGVEVFGVDASGVIAMVQDVHSVRDRPVQQGPCNARGFALLALSIERTVSADPNGSPLPASAFNLANAHPESGYLSGCEVGYAFHVAPPCRCSPALGCIQHREGISASYFTMIGAGYGR